MAKVTVNEESLQNIANAIRTKNGLSEKYKPSEMDDAILALDAGGGEIPTMTDAELLEYLGLGGN